MYVIITGTSSGIGRATALLLNQQPGIHVFAGVRNLAAWEESPSQLTPVLLDVTRTETIQQTVDRVAARLGEASQEICVVNNAGRSGLEPLEFCPLDEVRAQFEVNLFGALAMAQAFLPLIRQHGGRIVNIGSMYDRVAMPVVGAYCATKFGLRAMTDTLRLELSPWQIPVILIEPGVVATRMVHTAPEGLKAALPGETERAYYGATYDKTITTLNSVLRFAAKPEKVANVIYRSLRARRPKPYYRVGLDAWGMTLLSAFVPPGLRDWLVKKLYGFA